MQQAPRAGLEIDWSDPDTLTAVAGGILGLAVGIGAPLFYISRDEIDEKRLEELRELNRQTFKETGEYLSEVSTMTRPSMIKPLQYRSCKAGHCKVT